MKQPTKRPPPPAASARRRRRLVAGLRRLARWSLLVMLVAGIYGGFVLSRLPLGEEFLAEAVDRAIAASAALGLVVTSIEVEGRQTTDPATILAALAADRGTPILAVSPSRAKQELEKLPWVRSAAIERHLPGTLVVRLVERRPFAVWQHDGKQKLIDRQGEVIAIGDLSRFARLPSVVGETAAIHAAALLDMLAREPELAARVTAAIRVDDRRWNLHIDEAIEILLPQTNPEAAWAQLAELERRNNLLKRDIQAVDMRLPDRLVLRVNPPSTKEGAPKEATPGQTRQPGKNT
jgi:cell division protein FtsQ